MHRLQLIVNDSMRLKGIEETPAGNYVIADKWQRIETIGPQFEALILTCRVKAIAIDYDKREIKTVYNLKSPKFREIYEKSLEPYNPTKGYFWGADLLIILNNEYYSWFFCTPNLRAMIPAVTFRARYVVSSEWVKMMNGGFWKPKLRLLEERIDASMHIEAMKDFTLTGETDEL